MSYALIAKTAAGSGDALSVTTSAIDTTGADLIIVWIATTSAAHSLPPTDSKGNSWTGLTAQDVGGGERGYFYYCRPTSVGSGHTFSWSTDFAGGGTSPAICVQAFSGSVASPFDQESGGTTFGTSIQPGSQTPSEDNCLVVQGISFNTSSGLSINGSYNFAGDGTDYINVGANCKGAGMAYIIQTTAGATNPTWSTSLTSMVACSASFKAAGAAGDTLMPQICL